MCAAWVWPCHEVRSVCLCRVRCAWCVSVPVKGSRAVPEQDCLRESQSVEGVQIRNRAAIVASAFSHHAHHSSVSVQPLRLSTSPALFSRRPRTDMGVPSPPCPRVHRHRPQSAKRSTAKKPNGQTESGCRIKTAPRQSAPVAK